MSGNKKKMSLSNLLYNNRALMVFSVLAAILIWATVKINYSDETTRSLSDLKINISSSISQSGDYEVFFDDADVTASVTVSGKAYNINQYALSKDDIIVETSGSYIDTAGYKVLNLTARIAETAGVTDVEITNIEPSSITVYFDRKVTETFNVEAQLENDIKALVTDDFIVGQPVPSMSTIEVTGPATILNKLTKVYFRASIDSADLPLTATKEIPAEVAFQLERESEGKYLYCEGLNEESNPATVTVPLYVDKEVNTAVKFVNQPSVYSENLPKYKISPDKVKVIYNAAESDENDNLYVGTVDFRKVSNKVNYFEFPIDEKLSVNISDKNIKSFYVTLDMSSMSRVVLNEIPGKVVLVNQDDGFNYNINYQSSNLDEIVVIGPREALEKITADDIQIEINVSSLSKLRTSEQTVDVSNISIASEDFADCWVYGEYSVVISVEPKEE